MKSDPDPRPLTPDPSLPIDRFLPQLGASLRASQNLIIQAAPGAGKTTRVPPWLLDSGFGSGREVVVVEPRRLAVRLAANRVAAERNERVGDSVGYTVRYDDVSSAATRLRFVTEGVLSRQLLADRNLDQVGVVVLDEFHERHLQSDLAIALLRRLQRASRPDLRIVVMSATLDAKAVSDFLEAPCLNVPGYLHPVEIEYLSQFDARPLADQVESAVRRVIAAEPDGDILVFLPGAAEIRRATSSCQKVAQEAELLVLPLHGDLSAADQDRAVRANERRKLILSTNVAESSVTIDGVVAVVDSGLARVASHSPWTGLPSLETSRISRSSAAQRAGRAGRTRPGRCLRLYTSTDYHARPEFDMPEVARQDLAEPVLELSALGVRDPGDFLWFERPSESSLGAAQSLLRKLSAVAHDGTLTQIGERMVKFPVHPRLGRLIVECEAKGIGEDGALLAALLTEGDILRSGPFGENRRLIRAESGHVSDLLLRMERFSEARASRFDREELSRMSLDYSSLQAVERLRAQLVRRVLKTTNRADLASATREDAMLIAILLAFPDRVARRIDFDQRRSRRRESDGNDGPEVLLSAGGAARLSRSSAVDAEEFLVAIDAELRERAGSAETRTVLIRLASKIKVEWLLDFCMDGIEERDEAVWNRRLERVDVIRRLYYDSLIVDEQELRQAVGEEVETLLAKMALEAGIETFASQDDVSEFAGRIDFVMRTLPELGLTFGEDDAREALRGLCRGRRSLAEVRKAAEKGGLKREMRRCVMKRATPEGRQRFDEVAPERIKLRNGREVRVRYPMGGAPWIAARMQEFFGMGEGPRIGEGRVGVVLHLLAPNQRPVQVTSDLGGFWVRHYPALRRELGRRYPRHQWPEDPLKGD